MSDEIYIEKPYHTYLYCVLNKRNFNPQILIKTFAYKISENIYTFTHLLIVFKYQNNRI